MAVKFQFQFAGVDLARPSSPHRKWMRAGIYAMVFMLVGLAYWGYLHHLTHGRVSGVTRGVASAPVAVAPVAIKPTGTVIPTAIAAPAIPATPAAPASSLKKVADDSMVAVESSLSRMVKTAPTPTAPAVSADDATTKPETTTMAEPIIAYTPVNPSANRTSRPLRVHTESERLAMAGQTAFGNMMELATKYPDAYGFQAGDFLSDAKLGAPMPVYTITEADRASYQAGQSVKSLLKPSRQWVFPVLIGDRLCCMVQVKQNGHEFIPGKSNKSLAMAWNKIQERWPTEEGYHPLLVVNPDVPGYYFTVPELPQPNITDVIEMFFIHPGISPADVILASWR